MSKPLDHGEDILREALGMDVDVDPQEVRRRIKQALSLLAPEQAAAIKAVSKHGWQKGAVSLKVTQLVLLDRFNSALKEFERFGSATYVVACPDST